MSPPCERRFALVVLFTVKLHMASHEVPSASDSKGRSAAPLQCSVPAGDEGRAAPIVSGLGTAVHDTHSSSDAVSSHPLHKFVERISSRQQQQSHEPPAQSSNQTMSNGNANGTAANHHRPSDNITRAPSASSNYFRSSGSNVATPTPLTNSRASTPSMIGSNNTLLHYFRYNIPLEYREPSGSPQHHDDHHETPHVSSSGGEMRTVKDWLRRNRARLQETGAAVVTPHVSNKLSAIPRTLADKAIRLSGYRSASALARAFETTPSAEVIMHDNRIRFGEKILSTASRR